MNARLVLLVLLAAPSVAFADGKPTLKVFPPKISLNGQGDRIGLVVQEIDAQGLTKDVTATATFALADASLATLSGSQLAPSKDGTTKLVVTSGNLTAEADVTVANAATARAVSFRLDVMPIFMKHGCNNGSCHGAARGKDGFMLSLFGYDPAGDFHRLTRAIIGRRVDLAVPAKSLILEKVTATVPHTGGKLFDENHDDYKTILAWLKAGAPDDGADMPEPVGIELLPSKIVFPGGNRTQKTVVLAKYSDGSVRDVTRLALYLTNNETIAAIDKNGVVKAGGRGSAFVFARFSKFTVGSEAIVLPTNDNFEWPNTKESNYIDSLVFDKLKKLHIAPSELASDEAFLRRVYLDLIGLPPTRDEYDAFLADKAADKRAKLIDALMDRPEFADMWTMKWGELLRIRANNQTPQYGRDAKAMYSFSQWVKEQVKQNRPLDEFVADLLVGTGSNIKRPTANLYTSAERITPEKTAEDLAQVFLGTRIQCAQCHNHPFDRWTMDDYYGFAAFFAGVNLKRGLEGREVVVTYNTNNTTVAHPLDGRRMKPKFLGGDAPDVDGKDPRPALAKWLASADNPAFAQTMANMIWSHFFGRGIVDPVDDVRISNPPSNKELLDAIGSKLGGYRFDMKKLVRDICNSRTYQLAATTNPTNELDETQFSHSYVRRLRAEVLLDSISRITGTEDRFALSPPGTRAVQIHTGEVTNYFLTTFGRAPRETPCSCEVSREANLSQALHLVNGDTITNKVKQSKLVKDLVADKNKPETIVEEFYIRTLGRKPNEGEIKRLMVIVNRELGDPKRVKELVALQAGSDPQHGKLLDRVKSLKADAAKKPKGGKDLVATERQIKNLEGQIAAIEARYATNAAVTVYGDILWSLFNSTEFTFNH